MIGQIIHYVFLTYMIILAVRIIGSWFPGFATHPYMGVMAQLTDPYLNFFRRVVPPIGGTLDLSPILGYLVLKVTEELLRVIFK